MDPLCTNPSNDLEESRNVTVIEELVYKPGSSPSQSLSHSQHASPVSSLTPKLHGGYGSSAGIAFRLPGGVRDAEQFWDVLSNGKDMKGEVPSSRYNTSGFENHSMPKYGYFLEEDLSAFDASFFNMRKAELEMMDPQQRLLLEITRECLENAGEVDFRGKKIEIYSVSQTMSALTKATAAKKGRPHLAGKIWFV